MPKETAVYTHGHHESVLRSHRWRTAANSAAYLIAELRPGQTVLDVGCGPGTITADIAALVAPGRVTAVDTSTGVLDRAAEAAAERGVDNVGFTTADVHCLDFPDDSFDVVHAHQVLQHVGDPVQALREMRRVCRPGGVVAARDSDYAAMAWYPEVPGMHEWQDLYDRVARANGGEPDAGRRLLSWARQAGFTDITPTAAAWCFATPDDRAWWSGLWADRTTASVYAELAVDGGHASPGQLTAIADAWRAWGEEPDAWFMVPHGEVLCRV
ncbi:methyltransferase domain-containing protein [[Kitasatospora] papulosa]|uniref:methyltransferase domain-containing protein n=1 Tax=Streptomyces TaxID=1883 RepID=UPI000BCE6A0C|nr:MULTISPECIES: methyltransferase domain-containing protein [unclassified Streptomyces]MDF6065717.1 methyltransferase domain-containing protein [Streptomyces sp. JH010]MEE1776029.1 methyltransferase domain-containing protein [Streptomyces sp. JV181]RAS29024.1 methyltransferase family protein [Streptomyces avidinii]SNX78581.1 Methyltransferase domain-containing protein [Streptomyces microflavus]